MICAVSPNAQRSHAGPMALDHAASELPALAAATRFNYGCICWLRALIKHVPALNSNPGLITYGRNSGFDARSAAIHPLRLDSIIGGNSILSRLSRLWLSALQPVIAPRRRH